MKRYLLFAYANYESAGGWNDFLDSFDSLESSQACGDGWLRASTGSRQYHVIDGVTGKCVWSGNRENGGYQFNHNLHKYEPLPGVFKSGPVSE